MHNAFNAMNGAATDNKDVVIQNVVCACAWLRGRADTIRDLDGPALAAVCACLVSRVADDRKTRSRAAGSSPSWLGLSKSSVLSSRSGHHARSGYRLLHSFKLALSCRAVWLRSFHLHDLCPVPADVGSAASGRTDEQD